MCSARKASPEYMHGSGVQPQVSKLALCSQWSQRPGVGGQGMGQRNSGI